MTKSLNPTDNPELYDAAVLGKQIDEFWDSAIGQYLLGMALRDYNKALEEFMECDTTDYKTVCRIQSDMKRAASFREWLSLAIDEGIKAINIIQGNDDHEN